MLYFSREGTPSLLLFTAPYNPSYGRESGRGRRIYRDESPDSWDPVGAIRPPDRGTLTTKSLDLTERIWAGVDPIAFDDNLKALLKRTTEFAAGAILAFWDEVKDYECPCNDFTPCSFGKNGDGEPDCSGRPSLPTPGRGYPDDNASILALTASAGSESAAGPVSEADAVYLSGRWRQVAAVGVEKGIPSLVDLGRASWLLEVGDGQDLTDESKNLVARGIGALEETYTAPPRRPEDDLPVAANVALFNAGYFGGGEALLDRLGLTYVTLEPIFDPLRAAREFAVLLVPSGGLYGTAGSSDLRERFEAYVEAGGTLVVLAQIRGTDYASVPTPAGEALGGYGWFEDQACWQNNVRLAAMHPITGSADREVLSVPVDGFLDRWPKQATVLLRRAGTGTAALLTYPLGAGNVVVSTSYEDFAEANRATSNDGLNLLANAVSWARARPRAIVRCRLGEACAAPVPVEVRNLTGERADTVAWTLRRPTGETQKMWREPLDIGPGETVSLEVSVPAAVSGSPGVYRVGYMLEDSTRALATSSGGATPWIVQPEGGSGFLLVEAWPASVADAPTLSVGLAVDSEIVLNHSTIPAHLSVTNGGDHDFAGHVAFDYWAPAHHGPVYLVDLPVSAPSGSVATVDALVGPLDLQPGHDGLPGGGYLRARIYPESATEPIAVTGRPLLTNARFFDIDFRAAVDEAGPGDTVPFTATLGNQSAGEVSGRWRIVYSNQYNVQSPREQIVRTPWSDFRVTSDSTLVVSDSFLVPPDWQGRVDARLCFCYPDLRCWVTGNESQSSRIFASTRLALPMSRAAMEIGPPMVTDGPSLRIPVHVVNAGRRLINDGQIRVSLAGLSAMESEAFDLAAGSQTDIDLEIPFTGNEQVQKSSVTVSFTDRLWRARDPNGPWHFTVSEPLSYGVEVAAASPLAATAGSGAVRGDIEIRNTSTFSRVFTVDVQAPDLGYSEQRSLSLPSLASSQIPVEIPITKALPYGHYHLELATSDGQALQTGTTLTYVLNKPGISISQKLGHSPRAGTLLPVELGVVARALDGELSGVVNLSLPDAGFSDERPVTVTPGECPAVDFSIPLPEDLSAGEHRAVASWLEPNGNRVVHEFEVSVPHPRYAFLLPETAADAGGAITYEVRNTGGAAGIVAGEWRLRQGLRPLVVDSFEVSVAAGGTATLSRSLPASLARGSYLSELSFNQGTGEADRAVDAVAVAGLEAELDIAAEKPVFRAGEALGATTRLSVGASPLADCAVHLEVRGVHASCPRVEPWGVFQGSSLRSGFSPQGRSATIWPEVHFTPLAGAPTAGMIVAEATGDLNADGRDDAVIVESTPGEAILAIYTGPDLAPAGRVSLGPPPLSAALAVGDADGDGVLEVYVVVATTDRGVIVRSFSHTLLPGWETTIAAGPVPADPFPAGGPVLCDLDGDAGLEILLSTGSDVVALDPSEGTELWHLGGTWPELSEWTVSGLSAGDVTGGVSAEAALGLRSRHDPSTGRVALLASDGKILWEVDTPHPVAGAPVIIPEGAQPARIAVVDTPPTTDESSTLTIFAADGTPIACSTQAFWSPFQPAAGDVDGDGQVELAVVSGTPDCWACALSGVVVFRDDASVACLDSSWPPGRTPPVLLDADGRTPVDTLAVTAGGGYGAELGAWDTWYCGQYGWAEATVATPLVLDVDGDCEPEILVGGLAYGTVSAPPRVRAAAASALSAAGELEYEVLWSWDGAVDGAPGQLVELAHLLSTKGRTGLFELHGTLTNALDQTIAAAGASFSVVPSDIQLSVEPLEAAYAPGQEVVIDGLVCNESQEPLEGDVLISVDHGAPTAVALSVLQAEDAPFSVTIPAPGPGLHTVDVEVRGAASALAAGELGMLVEEPAVTITIQAPEAVGSDPFPVTLVLHNPTHLALRLETSFGTEQSPGDCSHVDLEPDTTLSVTDRFTIDAETAFVAAVRGDVEIDARADVSFDAVPAVALESPLALATGNRALVVPVANAGGHTFRGDLSWALSGASSGSGNVSLELEPGQGTALPIDVSIGEGNSTLTITAGSSTTQVTIEGYRSSKGSLELILPRTVVEGAVDVGLAVANQLEMDGEFTASLEVRRIGDGELLTTVSRTLLLGPLATDRAAATVALDPGDYLFTASLGSAFDAAIQKSVHVLPRRSVGVVASAGSVTDSGAIPLHLTLTNTGADAADATVAVRVGDDSVLLPVAVRPLSPVDLTVPILTDQLPSGTASVIVVLLDGRGVDRSSQPRGLPDSAG